jgi:hypothetical protein
MGKPPRVNQDTTGVKLEQKNVRRVSIGGLRFYPVTITHVPIAHIRIEAPQCVQCIFFCARHRIAWRIESGRVIMILQALGMDVFIMGASNLPMRMMFDCKHGHYLSLPLSDQRVDCAWNDPDTRGWTKMKVKPTIRFPCHLVDVSACICDVHIYSPIVQIASSRPITKANCPYATLIRMHST